MDMMRSISILNCFSEQLEQTHLCLSGQLQDTGTPCAIDGIAQRGTGIDVRHQILVNGKKSSIFQSVYKNIDRDVQMDQDGY